MNIRSYEGIKYDTTLRAYKHTWSYPKKIILSPTYPHGDATDPRVSAIPCSKYSTIVYRCYPSFAVQVLGQYLGDLLPSRQFEDLTNRYLFVPSLYDPYGNRLNSSDKLHLNPGAFRKHKQVQVIF